MLSSHTERLGSSWANKARKSDHTTSGCPLASDADFLLGGIKPALLSQNTKKAPWTSSSWLFPYYICKSPQKRFKGLFSIDWVKVTGFYHDIIEHRWMSWKSWFLFLGKEKVFLEASFDMTINNFFMVNSCNFSGETPLKFRLFSGDARMRTRRGLWRASRQGK